MNFLMISLVLDTIFQKKNEIKKSESEIIIGLPSKKEWDKIVDSAFSSESIHQFSEGYIKRRTGLQKGIIMDSSERKRIKEN